MVNTALRPDASLAEILTTYARSASDTRLALDLSAGLSVAAAAYVWRPKGWLLFLSASLCFAAFGGWGMADRELHETSGRARWIPRPALRAVRIATVMVGAIAALYLIGTILTIPFGPSWKS